MKKNRKATNIEWDSSCKSIIGIQAANYTIPQLKTYTLGNCI
jgi:hypothetical protein